MNSDILDTMDEDEVKTQRAAAKRSVTIIINKIRKCLENAKTIDSQLLQSLEKSYDSVSELHAKCMELLGEDESYLDPITKDYFSISNLIDELKFTQRLKQINRDIHTLNNLLDEVDSSLDTFTHASVTSLKYDLGEILKQKEIIVKHLSDLSSLSIDSISKQSELESLLKRASLVIKRVTVQLEDKQPPQITTVSPSPSVDSQATVINQATTKGRRHSTGTTGYIEDVPVSAYNTPGTAVSTNTGFAPHMYTGGTPTYEPVTAVSTNTGFTPSMYNVSTSAYTSGIHFSTNNGLTPALHTNPMTSYTPGTAIRTSVDSASAQYATHMTGYMPGTLTGAHNYTPNSFSGMFMSDQPPIRTGTFHTKLPELLAFSGERADWPEFKCVWRSLAESQFQNRMQLALELKRACSKGRAAQILKHIYATSPGAYDEMWSRLKDEYDDPGLSVQTAITRLMSIKTVDEHDYKGIVKLVDTVEGVLNQLRELNLVDAINMVEVDRICLTLPKSMQKDWLRRYRDLQPIDKIKPFSQFVKFLREERSTVARLSEYSQQVSRQPKIERRGTLAANGIHSASQSHFISDNTATVPEKKTEKVKVMCAVHGEGSRHMTAECRQFKEMHVSKKYDALKSKNLCFTCLKRHSRGECKSSVCKCGKKHHKLLCKMTENVSATHMIDTKGTDHSKSDTADDIIPVSTGLVNNGAMALYPIHGVGIAGTSRVITAFMDGGSNASYVTERCAAKNRFARVSKVTLDVTTVGGQQTEFYSNIYEVPLRTRTGTIVKVQAYGLPDITGKLSDLDRKVIEKLFPDHDPDALMRSTNTVDMLIGTDYFGLHPKHEIARAGDHLSIMQGNLGICLVGTHPSLMEKTVINKNVPKTLHLSRTRVQSHLSILRGTHPAFSNPYAFFQGEDMGTSCSPKCGSCKCGNCPLPGHDLSFREEQELSMIRANLKYQDNGKYWTTSYPWLVDPMTLPNNFSAAYATLKSTERSLAKDPKWASSYSDQIHDMLDRKVARKLTADDINQWQGPEFYISHLAVASPKSNSTPVRIVFNSSQTFHGISLNSCLAKGPDSFHNTSLGILLRWKEEPIAIVGDIRKMFHSVHLEPLEQHCHRFLWRDLNSSKDPEVYVMERVNMGDKPAPAIATEALYMTADLGREISTRAVELIKRSSYVDDLIDSVKTVEEAENLTGEVNLILAKGGFEVKCWQKTGDDLSLTEAAQNLKCDESNIGVLGINWNPLSDTISFNISLNFSRKRQGRSVGPDLKEKDIPECIPEILTKRQVLRQVMSIYDPMGLASPFTLIGKIYLRDTWVLKLDWDDPLPPSLRIKWVEFFKSLFHLQGIQYPRCLRPGHENGNPWLIILSDGSDIAYGCAAYIRWTCNNGEIKMRLIMAKSRIAPINKVSTPRMELNAAVLSKRCRATIEKEMRYSFERVLHLVDSETVLNMINKTSTRFKIYEGVRIGEIQAATHGDMSEWAWIPGSENISDWLTRGKCPEALSDDSEWFNGPHALHKPFESWNIKFGKTNDTILPGEKRIVKTHTVDATTEPFLEYKNVRSLSKAQRVMARILAIIEQRSFKGGHVNNITTEKMKQAEVMILLEAQKNLEMGNGNFKRLNPAKNSKGLWVVGSNRLLLDNPMNSINSDLPVFLPKHHPIAHLAMVDAHEKGHRGRDATLALFRNKYWTPQGPSLAKRIRNNYQLCKLRDAKLINQEMGSLPVERLRPSPPFTNVMVDMFGPYPIRGEVQKRTTGKAWCVIFTDLYCRAIQVEPVFGYDTSHFLLALSRFASMRGWPEKIFSDPGSQLLGANREINEAAKRNGIDHGMQWIVGPADSPWRQGAVESLVKSTKRALHYAVNNQRLSAPEFLTVCTEAANLINERPIGLLPSLDSQINVLTPNCLLLGRATSANPGGWQPQSSSMKTRYDLVSHIGTQFWKHWIEYFAPTLVYQNKWYQRSRDLKVGDIVLVADANTLKGNYRLARVTMTHPSKDGKVRTATVSYKNFKAGETVRQYSGSKDISVTRSAQRLVLLVPVDEPYEDMVP